jgi:hypothetical protein
MNLVIGKSPFEDHLEFKLDNSGHPVIEGCALGDSSVFKLDQKALNSIVNWLQGYGQAALNRLNKLNNG